MSSLSHAEFAQQRATQKYGVDTGPDFSHFKMNNYDGPGGFAGQQKGNRGTTQYFIETKQLSPDKPISISTDTMGGLYGGGLMAGMGGA